MSLVTVATTNPNLPIQPLSSFSDAGYAAGQLLNLGFTGIATIDGAVSTQFQSGLYQTGASSDGTFYLKTQSYSVFTDGTFGQFGSNITHIQITSSSSPGSYLDEYGTFNYSGLPFVSSRTAANINEVIVTAPINATTTIQKAYYGNLTVGTNGSITGTITKFIEVIENTSTLIESGFSFSGIATVSTNEFNPNSTSITNASITEVQLIAENLNLPSSSNTNVMSYSGNTGWPIGTPLYQLKLTTGNDSYILNGTVGQTFNAGSGSASYAINSSGNTIIGGSVTDNVYYSGNSSNYSIQLNSGSVLVVDLTSSSDTNNTLVGISRMHFSDTMIAIDTGSTQNAGSAYMLYQAAFNRTPDAAGLGYWIAQIDNGMNINSVAQNFIASAEFATDYGGANPSVQTLVTLLYNNVLHRAPDAGGFAYWQNQLNTNAFTKAQVLEYFAASPENVTNVTPAIAHGIHYTMWTG